MFSYVLFFGLLALSCSTFAYQENGKNSNQLLGDNTEEYKFLYYLDEECADKVTEHKIENFKPFQTVKEILSVLLQENFNYFACLGEKNLVNSHGSIDQPDLEEAIKKVGYEDEEFVNTLSRHCLSRDIRSETDSAYTIKFLSYCLLNELLYLNMSEEEKNNFDNLVPLYQENFVPSEETVMKTVNEYHGILLGKSAPKF